MNNQLDIYVWSIENRHTVRVDACGIRLELACFTDKQVAANFRDWVAVQPGLEAFMREVARYHGVGFQPPTEAIFEFGALLLTRRQHPAQLWRDDVLNVIRLIRGIAR